MFLFIKDIIPEPLFNVNENVSSVKSFDTEPRRTPARTSALLRPGNASDLMRGAFQLTEKNFLQKLTELFLRTAPTILKILHDRFSHEEEISMTGLTTTFNAVRLDVSNFHIHHV